MPDGPGLVADCVLFDPGGRVLLIRRGRPPFEGRYALPGGFVDRGETVEAACRRELEEETGVRAGELHLLGVYSDPKRDPRGHNVSITFVGVTDGAEAKAGDDAAAVAWVAEWRGVDLAFDHAEILRDAERWRAGTQAADRGSLWTLGSAPAIG